MNKSKVTKQRSTFGYFLKISKQFRKSLTPKKTESLIKLPFPKRFRTNWNFYVQVGIFFKNWDYNFQNYSIPTFFIIIRKNLPRLMGKPKIFQMSWRHWQINGLRCPKEKRSHTIDCMSKTDKDLMRNWKNFGRNINIKRNKLWNKYF